MWARGQGAVPNVASLLASAGALPATHGGSKGSVVAFTRTFAAELEGSGVHVLVLCPGMTAQDVVQASLGGLDDGGVLVAPGLWDDGAVQVLVAAESGLRSTSAPDLAPRYRS